MRQSERSALEGASAKREPNKKNGPRKRHQSAAASARILPQVTRDIVYATGTAGCSVGPDLVAALPAYSILSSRLAISASSLSRLTSVETMSPSRSRRQILGQCRTL